MQHPYLKLNPPSHVTKDLFQLRQALNSGNAAHPEKSYIADKEGSHKSSNTKNDSLILHDFFGALNY